MLTPEQIAGLNEFVDHALMAAARAAHQAAWQRHTDTVAKITEAEATLVKAKSDRAAILSAGAGGGACVTAQHSADTARAVREAEDHVKFLRELAAGMNAETIRLDAALMKAQRDAYLPVIRHGARMRLEAAARLDRARADLAEAESAYDAASEIVAHGAHHFRPHVQLVPGTRPAAPDPGGYIRMRLGATEEAALWRSAGIDLDPPATEPKEAA